jgi:hypothetical protein
MLAGSATAQTLMMARAVGKVKSQGPGGATPVSPTGILSERAGAFFEAGYSSE